MGPPDSVGLLNSKGVIEMRMRQINIEIMKFLVIAVLAFLVAAGSLSFFATIYPLTALILTIHMWTSNNGWRTKTFMTIIYLSVMVVQLIFCVLVVFSGVQTGFLFELKRIVAVCMIMVPFFALYMNYLYAAQKRFLSCCP